MMNVDLRPVGGVRKRDGMSPLSGLPGSGSIHNLVSVNTLTDTMVYVVSGTSLIGSQDPSVSWTILTDNAFAVGGKGRCENAYFVDEDDAADSSDWTFHNSTAYLVTGKDEPIIAFGDLTPGSQSMAWPEGVYDADPSIAKRGYPPRWKDIDGLGLECWPSGLFYAGDAALVESTIHDPSYARMFAYGFEHDPDRIDYSQLGVPYNMLNADVSDAASVNVVQDAGFFYCMRGDGDRVVGVRQLADLYIVFKEHRTCIYNGSFGVDFGLVGVLPVGAVSDESIVMAGNDIFFWTEGGPRVLSGVIKYGAINEFNIGDDISESFLSVHADSLTSIHGRFERQFNRIVWHVGTTSSVIDTCFVYYLPEKDDEDGRWSRWNAGYAGIISTDQLLPVAGAREFIYGVNTAREVFTMNSGVVDGTTNISAYYVTRWMDLSVLSINKRLLSLIAVYGNEGRGESVLEYALDYDAGFSETGHVIKELGGGEGRNGLWDHSTWDDPEFLWDITGRGMSKFGLSGLGTILRFKVSDDSEFGFSISGMALDVSYKGKG